MEQQEQGSVYDDVLTDDERNEAAEAYRQAVLQALSSTLVRDRRKYVEGRASLLIEASWQGDEEFYVGYDDANRHEFANYVNKPVAGGGSTEQDRVEPVKGSTVFPNITQPYVDAAAARVGDMLLPTDDRNFAIEATPIPDMFEGLQALLDKKPPAMPQPAVAPMAQPVVPQSAQVGMAQVPGSPMPAQAAGQPPAPEPQVRMPDGQVVPLSQAKAQFDAMKKEADRKAEKAQTQIDDWLTECQYNSELRKVIDDCARIGSGVIKGPYPVKRVSQEWRQGDDGVYQMILKEEIKPGSRRIDPWDFFPDPACGENIHNGSGTYERDRISPKQLEDLIGTPGYDADSIKQCLKEGPMRIQEADRRNMLSTAFQMRDQFEIWYFYGNLKVEELMCAGCDCEGADPDTSLPAIITLVNDRIIKASLNPLDNGEFPYDVIPWKRRPGIPWGLGVARQMRYPQRIVTAAARNLMDNAGLASGPQLVFRYGYEPENGSWEITPLKVWIAEEGDAVPTGAPVTPVIIPMLQKELMEIIQWGTKLAEDVTGLPMLLQGQGTGAPDTVGGLVLLDNNATAVLRRFARTFDGYITTPHISRYYAWNMCYGTDDDAKGDFQIKARGSSALVERSVQSQELINVVQLAANPIYGKSPKRAMDEYLRSRRFDPEAFDYTDAEKQEMANQPPPEDPRVTAAKIMADSRVKDIQLRQQGDQAKQQSQQQFTAQESERDRQFQQAMAELTADLDAREQNGKKEISTDELKAMLASVTMKLQTQKELSYQSTSADLHKHANPSPQVLTPPTEPAGRAPVGEAFQA